MGSDEEVSQDSGSFSALRTIAAPCPAREKMCFPSQGFDENPIVNIGNDEGFV
jgi:hypothetical protein